MEKRKRSRTNHRVAVFRGVWRVPEIFGKTKRREKNKIRSFSETRKDLKYVHEICVICVVHFPG